MMNSAKTCIIASLLAFFGYQPLMAADYTCSITIRGGEIYSTCQEPVEIVQRDDANGRAIVRVDMQSMGNWNCLNATAVIANPEGWVLNVGNSPTNNGYGGDGATFSNDSETEIVVPSGASSGVLHLYHNDYSVGPYPMMTVDELISDFSIMKLSFGDQYFHAKSSASPKTRHFFKDGQSTETSQDYSKLKWMLSHQETKNVTLWSQFIYRLGGSDDEAGRNDFIYWIGINTVVNSTIGSRVGSGVRKIIITVTTDACGS